MSTENVPPTSSPGATAKGFAASLASRGKAAGKLVAKQTERTKLVNVTLPGCYQALGKHLYDAGNRRHDLAANYRTIDGLFGQSKAVEARSASDRKAEGIAAKAKAAAKATQDKMHVTSLRMKINHAFGELGKAAFEKHGAQSGPEELVRPISEGRSRLRTLDADIRRLSTSQPGQILTPKRIAIGGGVLAVLLLLLVARSVFGGRTPYAHLQTRFENLLEQTEEESGRSEQASASLQKEVDAMFANVAPPRISTDESDEKVRSVEIDPPVYSSNRLLGNHWTFPIRFHLKSDWDRFNDMLIYKVYSIDGTVIDNGSVTVTAGGKAGDRLNGSLILTSKSIFEVNALTVSSGSIRGRRLQ